MNQSLNRIENILSEYGDRVANVLFFEGYLNEYGKLMVEHDAISVFASMI
jgi:negative regulator of genetic competence, sporulation and motility